MIEEDINEINSQNSLNNILSSLPINKMELDDILVGDLIADQRIWEHRSPIKSVKLLIGINNTISMSALINVETGELVNGLDTTQLFELLFKNLNIKVIENLPDEILI